MSIDDEFTFGKYKGKTPRNLIRENRGTYLVWCLENISHFHLYPYQFEHAVREAYASRYKAIRKKERDVRKNMQMQERIFQQKN